jgi:hypothetical protein
VWSNVQKREFVQPNVTATQQFSVPENFDILKSRYEHLPKELTGKFD